MWKRKSKKEKELEQQQYQSTWEDDCSEVSTDQLNYDDQLQKFEKQDQIKAKKRTKSKEYYVKGSDLKQQIRKYQESKRLDAQKKGVSYQQGEGIISDKLGQMIIKICTRFSMHPRFYGYSFRDEFVADAVARCITHRSR